MPNNDKIYADQWLKRMRDLPPGLSTREVMARLGCTHWNARFWMRVTKYPTRKDYVFSNGRRKKFDLKKLDLSLSIPELARQCGVSRQYAYAEVKRWKARQMA